MLVHPVPRTPEGVRQFFGKWDAIVAQDGKDERPGLCIMPNHPPENAPLEAMARRYFGDRCFVDPRDSGEHTKLIIADALLRLLAHRGNKTEWLPYETSSVALRRTHPSTNRGLRRSRSVRACIVALGRTVRRRSGA